MINEESNRYEWRNWTRFRLAYLKKIKRENGELVCEYCGKRNLHLKRSHGLDSLATIDHVKSLKRGGGRYDVKNMAVVCHKCNNDKGSDDYTMLLMRKHNPFKYFFVSLKKHLCEFLEF